MYPKPDKLMPALYGGIIIGALSGIPFVNIINCLCCAGIILGGVLSVYFYKSSFTPETPPLEAGECALVGLMAGVIGAIVETIISVALLVTFGNFWVEYIVEFLTRANVNLPDEVWDGLYRMLDSGPMGIEIMFDFVISLFISSLFGLLGGVVGYSLFKGQTRVMPPPPVQPGGQLP